MSNAHIKTTMHTHVTGLSTPHASLSGSIVTWTQSTARSLVCLLQGVQGAREQFNMKQSLVGGVETDIYIYIYRAKLVLPHSWRELMTRTDLPHHIPLVENQIRMSGMMLLTFERSSE